MKNLLVALSIAVSGLVAATGTESREVARACDAFLNRPRNTCCAIVIEKGVVLKRWIHDSAVTSEETLGPYLKEYQDLVGPKEAPVRLLSTSSGWKIIVSWGLPSEDWVFAEFRLYFLSPDGKLRLRWEGQSLLERVEAGRLFKTLTELVLVADRGSHSRSATVRVWVLPFEGDPRRILNESAMMGRIETGTGGKGPGLAVSKALSSSYPRSGSGWEKAFFAWDETTKSFRK